MDIIIHSCWIDSICIEREKWNRIFAELGDIIKLEEKLTLFGGISQDIHISELNVIGLSSINVERWRIPHREIFNQNIRAINDID